MAERLRELRAEKGYNQEGMAAIAEVSQSTWSSWEKGTPEQFAALRRLAERAGKSADYLLGITDDPTPATRRDEWTPEAIAAVSLVNELPAGKRGAALAVLKAAVELTQAEMLDTAAAPANVGGGVTLNRQIPEEQQKILNGQQKDELLALLRKMLPQADYDYVAKSVEAGEPLTEADINRLLQAPGHKPIQKGLETLNNNNLIGNG